MNGIWQSDNFGVDMCCMSIFPNAYCKTPTSVFCVNPATKNADKAVGMMALMATDPEIVNLMVNGIEGVHYVVKEDGTATYPEGVDSSNVGWCIGYSWANMNSTLSIPFNYPSNYFDLMLQSNKDGLKSNALASSWTAPTLPTRSPPAPTSTTSTSRPCSPTQWMTMTPWSRPAG